MLTPIKPHRGDVSEFLAEYVAVFGIGHLCRDAAAFLTAIIVVPAFFALALALVPTPASTASPHTPAVEDAGEQGGTSE